MKKKGRALFVGQQSKLKTGKKTVYKNMYRKRSNIKGLFLLNAQKARKKVKEEKKAQKKEKCFDLISRYFKKARELPMYFVAKK